MEYRHVLLVILAVASALLPAWSPGPRPAPGHGLASTLDLTTGIERPAFDLTTGIEPPPFDLTTRIHRPAFDLRPPRQDSGGHIRPYSENPSYWQYKGRPVLLVGGSKEDNLFQIPDLREHLDLLASSGGNYVRNTMSSRDSGNVWPFHRLADGRYDLERLNDEYFDRVRELLELAAERDVIVQIELWDRFDFAREPWLDNPYRPANNVNYATDESGLEDTYPKHPGSNENPFFRTVPAHDDNRLVLQYQQAQVDRLLDVALRYSNVLYTMDNETNGTPEWGAYWAAYVQRRAEETGAEVYTTEMWDDWDIKSEQHRRTLDHPKLYAFADISQNSHNSGEEHWRNLQWVRRYTSDRPLNNVKIYGADGGRYGSSRDGVERFWRNILGGAASARFHRPESGIGLTATAQASLRSARRFVEAFDLFRAMPDAEGSLLEGRGENEAYLSRIPGEQYAVYFPDGGSVALDLREVSGTFEVRWLDLARSAWRRAADARGSELVTLRAPDSGHWLALLSLADPTELTVTHDASAGTISVFRGDSAVLTQHARPNFRPYIHPVVPPDGKGVLTENRPAHHPHQTGLYWGFTRVNGRDYFHHPGGEYWRRVSADVLVSEGAEVRWRTVYDLLDETRSPILTETQVWSMHQEGERYVLDLEWSGEAATDVTIGEYDYGGLFLRMPWRQGVEGSIVNAARQRDGAAEGNRAMWLDVGMTVDGRDDMAHVAIFDHPDNEGFPQPWRVDDQMGVGPVRARMGDWTIVRGETEVIRHRLVLYTGEMTDVELHELWEDFSGRKGQYSATSLWEIARAEGRQAEFLTPDRAAEIMTLPEGFRVNAWVGEPMLTQPMAFAWDDRGRLWVAENRDYESRGTGFSGSGDSRILILEDTDRDGEADSRKVFLQGIPFPAAIAVGFGGVFLGAPPHLLFVPDRDGDDVADVDDIEVLLTGWGIRDRHETINSFHWGPDGWLYGLEGFATPSKIRKPHDGARLFKPGDPFPNDLLEGEGVDIDGGVWRYHPVKERFEVVAHGFSNPWGIDYDAKGQLFISACVIPHVFHVIPGGIYHRQGGTHFNPYVYSDIRTIVDHRHRSAHGGARVYQSDAFPAEHRGRLFMANIHEHAVLSDVLAPEGSGFVARHGDDFMMANNAQWIGFSLEIGPEGALYVLDWHDADICGESVMDKDTGRIFRITAEESPAENWEGRYADLTTMSDVELAALQTSESDWHARRARVILQHRATTRAIDAASELHALFEAHPNSDYRLRAMWALHVTGLLGEERLLEALQDSDEYVRAWAVQLLTEDYDPGAAALEQFERLARSDASPVVRKYLAAALQRIDRAERWSLAEGLLTRGEDAADHNIPRLIWYGIEPLVPADPERALALAGGSAIPLVAEFIARRAVDADALEALTSALSRYGEARVELLRGMRAGLEGRAGIEPPAGWDDVYADLRSDDSAAPIAVEVADNFGDVDAAQELLETLTSEGRPLDQRRRALHRLAERQHEALVAELPALFGDPDLRIDAIQAAAAFDDERLGTALLERYPDFTWNEKRAALQSLASRPAYGWMLTEAIKAGDVPRREVQADVARQLRRVVGSGFVEVWGPIDGDPSDVEGAYATYRTLLSPEAIAEASPVAGRRIFERACGSCHRMHGEGGALGPDLTGSNRTDLDYILTNLLEPSSVIQDDYRMVILTTRDGRTYIGNVSNETDRQVTLRVVGRDDVVLNKSAIQSREVSDRSLMPEGLLRTLTDEEVLDLIAFLQTTEQVPPPAE